MESDSVADGLEKLEILADADSLDDDQFISLWNVAAASTHGDAERSRDLASKLLGFLCQQRCPFVVVSQTDATYLDEWFERDNKLLHDWSAQSDRVDVLAQHAHVPFDLLTKFLAAHKFDAGHVYNPRRAAREAWFNDDWSVG